MNFNLKNFEYMVYNHDRELAGQELQKLLQLIDSEYGVLFSGRFDGGSQSPAVASELDSHVLSRIVAAITALVTDSGFQFSDNGFSSLLNMHRWLGGIFAASPFGNADHILRSLNKNGAESDDMQIDNENMRKFLLFYFSESEMKMDVEAIWAHDKKLMAGLALTLLSPRFLGTPSAHGKREALLKWLPSKLSEVDLDDLPGGILHDAYMHCSYADYEGKHDIKKPLNQLIRRKLADRALEDLRLLPERPRHEQKPVLVVALEWFSANHSIYRTHSLTMESMRRYFYVIGMGYDGRVDEIGKKVFDEFIDLRTGQDVWGDVAQIRDVCLDREAQVFYMPSVGMFPLTMLLSNARMAPLQMMALGHPATTHSPVMDYVVVEEDYVGDPACFSEELLILPSDGMPYRASAGLIGLKINRTRSNNERVVWIAVASTTMKLNPGFLETCAAIANQSKTPVEFHFLVGQGAGLSLPQVQRFIKRYLADKAVVHGHQDYQEYMRIIGECDMFLNPFPFGNTNGIVDTVYAGLMGICKTGREVHEHIDEGMFNRLGFPANLVAHSNDEYIDAALSLIDSRNERIRLAKKFTGPKAIENMIFKGRAEILGDMIYALWEARLDSVVTAPIQKKGGMMRETKKAALRRSKESVFKARYLVGKGIDIGAGDTPLMDYVDLFPEMESVYAWDIADGNAQHMTGVADEQYDFVYSSHCLEHMIDPRVALRNWIRILKYGGYLVVTIPDEDLYECGHWPSQFNRDHKWSFTLFKARSSMPKSLNVLTLLQEFGEEVECERIVQIRDGFDDTLGSDRDQTLGDAECAIEFVWRRRDNRDPVHVAARLLDQARIFEHVHHDDVAALGAYRAAALAPHKLFDLYRDFAHFLTRLGEYDEAEDLWKEAMRQVPGRQTRIYQALFLLQRGKYKEGFRLREASVPDSSRTPTLPNVPYPRWQGENLKGKSIVIWTEFGFGDEIMFSRFAQDLKATLGARSVTVLCQDAIYPMLAGQLLGADSVVPVSRRDEMDVHDFWVFPHSIPVYRQLTLETIPAHAYISVSDELSEKCASLFALSSKNFPKVGLVWQGNRTHENDKQRSFSSLSALSAILDVEGLTFISLQKGPGEAEAQDFAHRRSEFFAVGHDLEDFAQTAAVIANLDLVITVDTAVAHCAGALGKPVWLMLPTVCDWRWLLEREDSPWYPTMRIFRQQRLSDWDSVVSRIARELKEWSLVHQVCELPL